MEESKELLKPIRSLFCACCGGFTRGRQWFNQDTGYGICSDCIAWLRKPKSETGPPRESEAYIRDCYGIEGINFNVTDKAQVSYGRPSHSINPILNPIN